MELLRMLPSWDRMAPCGQRAPNAPRCDQPLGPTFLQTRPSSTRKMVKLSLFVRKSCPFLAWSAETAREGTSSPPLQVSPEEVAALLRNVDDSNMPSDELAANGIKVGGMKFVYILGEGDPRCLVYFATHPFRIQTPDDSPRRLAWPQGSRASSSVVRRARGVSW